MEVLMIENFNYKDTFVVVRDCKFIIENHKKGKTCLCCGKEFQNNEKCILLINNYKYIPNVIIHKDCFDRVLPEYKERLFENIEKDYKEYQELKKIFY